MSTPAFHADAPNWCLRVPPVGATRTAGLSSVATSSSAATKRNEAGTVRDWEAPNGLILHSVDLLVGADGSHSVVRDAVGVAFEPQDTLILPETARDGSSDIVGQAQRRRNLRLDVLEQTTLIAKFLQVQLQQFFSLLKHTIEYNVQLSNDAGSEEGIDDTITHQPEAHHS